MLMKECGIRRHDTGKPHRHDSPERIYIPGSSSAPRRTIELKEAILGENDRIASAIQKKLTEQKVFLVNVMGAPGAGKTSLLIHLIRELGDQVKPYVIEGDIEADFDALALQKLGIETIQINTGGACHLDAPLIDRALDGLSVAPGSVVFIENIGNLVCPAEFSIGEHVKLLVSPITEGSDKPYKYPLAFARADLIILNKMDLKPYTEFDEAFFTAGVRALNREVPIIACSAVTGEGFAEVAEWLMQRRSS